MEKLDSKPDQTGYSVSENASALAFVELEGGPGRSRLDELDGCRIVTLQWSGSKERFKYVRDFLTKNVALNCPQFLMDLIIQDFNYREYTCNLIPDSIKQSTPKGIAWTISASFEVMPRDDEENIWPDDLCENDDNVPYITKQPFGGSYGQCVPIAFSVGATGSGPLTYQWYKNGVAIPGATSSTYTYTDTCDLSHSGFKFFVILCNDLGCETSNEVQIALIQRYVQVYFVQAVDISGGTGVQKLTRNVVSSAFGHMGLFKDGVFVPNMTLSGANPFNEFTYGVDDGISSNGTFIAGHNRFWNNPTAGLYVNEVRFAPFGVVTTRTFRLDFLDASFNIIKSVNIPNSGGLAASLPSSVMLL